MPRSLRWTMIGWYGLLLVAVFAVFGVLLNLRVRQSLLGQVDTAIEGHGRAIAAALDWDLFAGWELDLSDEYLAAVARDGWFEITRPDGALVRSSGAIPAGAAPFTAGFRHFGTNREFLVEGPRATRVRVGRSVAPELADLYRLRILTVGVGVALMVVAIVGGWWFTTRTLRPIRSMSRAAGAISARDLSQRIAPESVPTELRDLASTLNSTFDRLSSAFESQARFTADASHELRTPLSVIRLQAELALRRERTAEDYRGALSACLRAAQRMSAIVEQLLALARADAGELQLAAEDVDFDLVVQETAEDAHAEARGAGVELAWDTAPIRVRGDATQLAEVVSNLLSNAIRYNREGGRVDVKLRRVNDCAVLQVHDTGSGIPDDALPFLFERFFQVDPARSRATGGSGLGLALARRIARAHGGDIDVESRAGVGSTFTVTLPATSSSVQVSGVG